jgi:squalene synthase HpnC
MLIADAPIDAPAVEAVMARAANENFPVASRVLARRVRAHLLAVYGFARLVDELGDGNESSPADRLAALDWLEAELDRAFQGQAEHPLLVRLQVSMNECGLAREPFARLIEANRMDQRVSRYQTWVQLQGYCALSADPVGELVLGVFGLATAERIVLSNSICTALQLAEHCQDVAEDLARGRIYLPREDLMRFGCTEAELAHKHASDALRGVLAFEVDRARRLLDDGLPLVAQLRGRPRIAVAAFVAGGYAALNAIERARYDVLDGPPRSGHARRALALLATLRASRSAAA